ncbi:tRNA:m(5)U-54 methyltransferase [Mesotoga prima MesG1.Ag.4.2]|uniref:Methylenetetrahydrofolate--tRNA-(uracil-5-)-methyltransferase TrmFO n=1 Tax=Mesotoga prima MesG1.Ag.4.2 TaxID=660470 RepID=I2F2U4_9BACT|nr:MULTISPECIES: methylenetetrahydrofolate--tRNA-(uracil(54)-C(5))-methyltransferase (FADH(2)-oxidizing) TrmFO [Mesotoga]AFK06247.1 tRNA:m(5)U-54 methyltransferase [Mesotoga prima MesG1.Ag.4.2]PIJ62052.1 tRNA (uracil-5-)-methyltransferase [Mesotoga sp. H07.pep.5.3]
MIINIIGGGLAGSEAALSLADFGQEVNLFEMRPNVKTDVHQSGDFAELVCSNSFKSESLDNASGLLKEEGLRLGSRLLEIAYHNRVPAGKALAVDRKAFSEEVSMKLETHPLINVRREEVCSLDFDGAVNVVCTGPLTSGCFEAFLGELFGGALFFFDAVAPIVAADSVDLERAFIADRYSDNGDYVNCSLSREEYELFWNELVHAEVLEVENFSDRFLFERCQPFEEIARSGIDALRFGPMKPVGLIDPITGKEPYAVVQLRKENLSGSLLGIVGFQTRLKWREQKRILSLIPALRNVDIIRYGVMHRNTFLDSPRLLNPDLQSRNHKGLFFAGQISGLEGYVEAIVSGRLAAINADRYVRGKQTVIPPVGTMIGGLINHITVSGRSPLKPVYANFGLLPEIRMKNRREKNRKKVVVAQEKIQRFLEVII